ncbi:hypothetical protein [Rothia nasimurium]|uniref:hypothetical protein n=1 Tax=Rothia nasimurium TaxID=85336 RepID=UPI001F30EE1E|nr:hypothetical protein [Rothia nasimurium]
MSYVYNQERPEDSLCCSPVTNSGSDHVWRTYWYKDHQEMEALKEWCDKLDDGKKSVVYGKLSHLLQRATKGTLKPKKDNEINHELDIVDTQPELFEVRQQWQKGIYYRQYHSEIIKDGIGYLVVCHAHLKETDKKSKEQIRDEQNKSMKQAGMRHNSGKKKFPEITEDESPEKYLFNTN